MKRIVLVLALLLVVFGTLQVCAAEESPISLEDAVVEYSPVGYIPEASCTFPVLTENVHYLAIDKKTAEPVELPLKNVGEYVVKAYATVGEIEYSDIANVTITPVKVTISVSYDKLRYTGDPVIPEYKIIPEWTAEYFQLNVTYTYFKENSPSSTKMVDAPISIGKYFVKMTPYGTGDNIDCDGKAYILTISESKGKKLSESKATAPVGSGISCELNDVETVYDGASPKIPYEMTPNGATAELYYRLIGTSDEPTTTPPTEPGEYEVTAVLCNQVLDRSTLIINKRVPTYKIETVTYKYTPSGVVPHIMAENGENIEFSISAFLVDENDEPISAETLPLKKVGKYLLIINPTDITHYEAIYCPEYIYIEKCTPTITSETRLFQYDGFSKEIGFEVNPYWLSSNCKIEYFELYKNGEIKSSLGSDAPINIGEYIAEITVAETATNDPATLRVRFEIEPSPEVTVSRPAESETEYIFLGVATPEFILTMIAVPSSLILLFVGFVWLQRKKERR